MKTSVKVAASSDTSGSVSSPQSITLTPLESPPTILTVVGGGASGNSASGSLGTLVATGNTVSIAGNVVLGEAATVQEILIISQDSPQPRQLSQSQQHQQQHQSQQTFSLAPVVRDISSTGGVMTG